MADSLSSDSKISMRKTSMRRLSSSKINQFRVIDASIENDSNIKIDSVKNVDWNRQRQQRAGVIPYYKINDEIIFILGQDRQSGDLTDFGGWKKISDNDSIETSLREFKEESLNVFGEITTDQVGDQIVAYSNSMLILFIYIEIDDITNSVRLFDRRCKRMESIYSSSEIKELPEMSNILCVHTKTLQTLINGDLVNKFNQRHQFYFRIKQFLINMLKTDDSFFDRLG
jgi:hypothetical protein